MKESKLTPFDVVTVLMVKSVTGHEPEITEKAELFEMRIVCFEHHTQFL